MPGRGEGEGGWSRLELTEPLVNGNARAYRSDTDQQTCPKYLLRRLIVMKIDKITHIKYMSYLGAH